MAFQGSLAELHLPDIIQLISVSGKTGVFHLVDGAHKGEIFLHEGRIVHAQLEEISGEEAVYALAIWNQGDFKFEPGAASEVKTISKSNTNLLMEAARRLDEWRVLQKKIPSVDMVPEFVVLESREGQINLNTSEWLILSKIDGHRSVKGIAQASNLSVFDAAKILYGLIATGLIRLKPPAGAPTPRSGAAVHTPAGGVPAAPRTGSHPAMPASQAGGASATPELLARLNRVRDICNGMLGAVGESVVNKHYVKAKSELERGSGAEAIEEAITQIARATSILKGPSTTEALLEQLKTVR
jgi:uncharacterized protein DUF4388